jgi:hypothetical protein
MSQAVVFWPLEDAQAARISRPAHPREGKVLEACTADGAFAADFIKK